MNGESAPSEINTEASSFPSGTLIRYPEDKGIIPLAEEFHTDGTEVNWLDNPYTQTRERQALIRTSDGGSYYLRGGALYDLGHRSADGIQKEIRWTPRTPMPNVTIGEPATFSSGANVESVVIQVGGVTAGDTRSDDILSQAEEVDNNPFTVCETQLKRHMISQARQRSNVDLTGLAVKDEGEEQAYGYTYRFSDPRMLDISADSRKDPKDPGDIRPGATTAPVGSSAAADEEPDRRKRSSSGVLISPPSELPKSGVDDYLSRPEVRMSRAVKGWFKGHKDSVKSSARALGEEIVDSHHESWGLTKEQAERLADTSIRIGNLAVGEVVATTRTATKGSRYMASFYAEVARGAADVYWQAAKYAADKTRSKLKRKS